MILPAKFALSVFSLDLLPPSFYNRLELRLGPPHLHQLKSTRMQYSPPLTFRPFDPSLQTHHLQVHGSGADRRSGLGYNVVIDQQSGVVLLHRFRSVGEEFDAGFVSPVVAHGA